MWTFLENREFISKQRTSSEIQWFIPDQFPMFRKTGLNVRHFLRWVKDGENDSFSLSSIACQNLNWDMYIPMEDTVKSSMGSCRYPRNSRAISPSMGIQYLILGRFRCLMLSIPFKTPLGSDCVVQLQSFGVSISAHPQHDVATTFSFFLSFLWKRFFGWWSVRYTVSTRICVLAVV